MFDVASNRTGEDSAMIFSNSMLISNFESYIAINL